MSKEIRTSKIESIVEIFFGFIWFAMSVLVLVLYFTGGLGSSIPVPKIFIFFYKILGIVPGGIVQILISGAIIIHGIYSLIKK